ncbi:MAG: efflux RND transporter periplasmic adaptor subunit [Betaproteobacteria bacterium]|nr:efflux RND transporter periplasmic adaptor subunit [Betaproteobacteria bacterium]
MNKPMQAPAAAAKSERKVLYYRNPMGLPDTSPVPKKAPDGMDYVPVYADEEASASAGSAKGKILYYRNPMGLPDRSPVPKKDPMGMDYVPVYEGEEPQGSQVKISLDKVQKLGVKTEAVSLREITRVVRAVGTLQVNERAQHTVTPKFEGWIQRLLVNTTGEFVRRGQPLMEVYSPDLIIAQQEYMVATKGIQALKDASPEMQANMRTLMEGSLQRLRNWDISAEELERLIKEGQARNSIVFRSPVSGVVLEKPSVQGMRFMPGEELYKIADLSSLWLLADVFEQDLAWVRSGQSARIRVSAYPERAFSGKVTFVYPTVKAETRTAQVRIELLNTGGLLKPDMYANVELLAGQGRARRAAVPDSAVLDSGVRQIVLVQRAEGLFEPREVKLGARGDGYVEVLEGVKQGEEVVVSANFLIDAESNLKAALSGFGGQGGADAGAKGR